MDGRLKGFLKVFLIRIVIIVLAIAGIAVYVYLTDSGEPEAERPPEPSAAVEAPRD